MSGGDILPDRPGIEERFLKNQTDIAPDITEPDFPQVDISNGNAAFPLFHVVKACKEISKGRFSTPRTAEDPDRLSGRNGKADIVQKIRPVSVAE